MKSCDRLNTLSYATMPERRAIVPRTRGSEITLRVVQGLGDIIWICQKFSPYFDRINFVILMTKDDPIQRRTVDWLKIFSKTGSVTTEIVPAKEYERIASQFYRMQDCLDAHDAGRPAEYAANAWLENGVRLDDIDPGSEIDNEVHVGVKARPGVKLTDYIVLYASASTTKKELQKDRRYAVWNCEQWAGFVNRFMDRMQIDVPVVVVGAGFDGEVVQKMYDLLTPNRTAYGLIGYEPAVVAGLIWRARCFIGYQSGLGILADLLGTRQMMLYFPIMRQMLDAWCRREHVGTKFQRACFDDNSDELIGRAVEAWK